MSQGGVTPILGGIVASACLLLAASASAATLTGDYQLQGTRASSGPGPALTDLGAGNGFATDTVMGVSRQVLTFPVGNGLQMSPAGLGDGTRPYSEVLTFRFDSVAGDYRRILDNTNGVGDTDTGLYANEGKIDLYVQTPGTDHESSSALLPSNTYATVAMVAAGFPTGTTAYFNGAPVANYPGDFNVTGDTLRFFQDDADEESGGALSCIRVFNGALTNGEVAAIGADPRCGAPATTTKKKCKKKKKKKKQQHQAAATKTAAGQVAKKKKCKKKKKKR